MDVEIDEINVRIVMVLLLFVFKVLNGLGPLYLSEILKP
mgnify:CR=1 FL=1